VNKPGREGAEVGTESNLIRRIVAGDVQAFHELVQPCQRSVYLTALSILNNEADAEETAQEAMLKAYRKLSGFRQDSAFKTWLTRITVNEALMRLRKDRRHCVESLDELRRDDSDYVSRDIPDVRCVPLEVLEQKQLRKMLAEALASLPSNYRVVVVLRDIEHFNIAETAKILSISEMNVKTRLLRGRLRMREALSRLASILPGIGGTPLPVRLRKQHEKWNEACNMGPALERRGSRSGIVCDPRT